MDKTQEGTKEQIPNKLSKKVKKQEADNLSLRPRRGILFIIGVIGLAIVGLFIFLVVSQLRGDPMNSTMDIDESTTIDSTIAEISSIETTTVEEIVSNESVSYDESGLSFSHPDSWEIITEVPEMYSSLLKGDCLVILQDANTLSNVIVIDGEQEGDECWKYGQFSFDSNREVRRKLIQVQKWNNIGGEWQGILTEEYATTVSVFLVYNIENQESVRRVFDDMVGTIAFEPEE